jgi:hypothetical protein
MTPMRYFLTLCDRTTNLPSFAYERPIKRFALVADRSEYHFRAW